MSKKARHKSLYREARDGDRRCPDCRLRMWSVRWGDNPGEWDPMRMATVDHYLPRSRGGRHLIGNTRLCCQGCNLRKADRLPRELDYQIKPLRPRRGRPPLPHTAPRSR